MVSISGFASTSVDEWGGSEGLSGGSEGLSGGGEPTGGGGLAAVERLASGKAMRVVSIVRTAIAGEAGLSNTRLAESPGGLPGRDDRSASRYEFKAGRITLASSFGLKMWRSVARGVGKTEVEIVLEFHNTEMQL
jgi:hypothetical protein